MSTKPITAHRHILKQFIIIESELDATAPLILFPQYPFIPPAIKDSVKNKYPIVFDSRDQI
jgi:hypothetical protein